MKGVVCRFVLWCPGAMGLWLRQKVLPRYFFSCGSGVLFGRFVKIIAPEKIILGDRVVLNNNATLDAGNARQDMPAIVLEDDVFIGTGTVLSCGESGSILIQSGANFSSSCSVEAGYPLEVGKDVLVAAYCVLGGETHRNQQEKPGKELPERRNETKVENGCWLGVRVHVNEGVSIGEETIVGAHAEVATDLPSFVIAVGKPARVIRDRRAENDDAF